jgi:hypothetical protein
VTPEDITAKIINAGVPKFAEKLVIKDVFRFGFFFPKK